MMSSIFLSGNVLFTNQEVPGLISGTAGKIFSIIKSSTAKVLVYFHFTGI